MNRRSFIKAAAAAFIVPQVIVPEQKIWALDRTMLNLPPARVHGDDTAWLQWLIDNRIDIPLGSYVVTAPLVLPKGGRIVSEGSNFIVRHKQAFLHIEDTFTPDQSRLANNHIHSMLEGVPLISVTLPPGIGYENRG